MDTLEKDNIVRLIANILAENPSNDDVAKLQEWIGASPTNRAYFLQLKNIWEVTGRQFSPDDISPELALKKVLNRISKPKLNLWVYWQKIAAIMIFPIIAASLWVILSGNNGSENSSASTVYNEVYANFGTRSALKLADGSLVWLNSGSSLRYPDKFLEKQRVVYLKGEAYFEVKSDISKPFIVQTPTVSVKATGTKFNVQSFSNNKRAEVSLVSGKVVVSKRNEQGQLSLLSELKPNQHLAYDTLTQKTETTEGDIYNYIAWKDGKLIFRNQPLHEVVKKISQVYQVDIELRGEKLQDYRYRATFEEESLTEILKLLKLSSPITYKELPRKPLPDGSFPKKKIIIYPMN